MYISLMYLTEPFVFLAGTKSGGIRIVLSSADEIPGKRITKQNRTGNVSNIFLISLLLWNSVSFSRVFVF